MRIADDADYTPPLIITDDTQETFDEDVIYLGILVTRIMRTAIRNHLDVSDLAGDDTAGGIRTDALDAVGSENVEQATAELDEADHPLVYATHGPSLVREREGNGRFKKHAS